MEYKNALDFKRKLAIVTGAIGSIGKEILKGFAQCGANVIGASSMGGSPL